MPYFINLPCKGLNAVLQLMSRCYPNTYVQQRNALERCGQAIVGKIRINDQKEPVTKAEAQAIFDALKEATIKENPTRSNSSRQQEDAAAVLDFLLHQGNIQEIEFYVTNIHRNGNV